MNGELLFLSLKGLINIYDLSKKEAMNVEVVVKEIEEVLR